MSTTVLAPLAGTVVAVENVPDPVFAQQLVGPGIAIDPERADGEDVTVVAPVAGTVAKAHPHACVLTTPDGRGLLLHLGLDTVGLGGRGFTVHVSEGHKVNSGDPLVTWNPAAIEAGGLNPVVPIIALEASPEALHIAAPGQHVAAGAPLFTWD